MVLLSSLLLVGWGSLAQAGEFFRRLKHKDCNTEVVNLPAQHVVVETTRPRVIVQDTVRTDRLIAGAAPYVATIYTAAALPLVGMPMTTGASGLDYRRTGASAALDSLHELEHQAVEIAKMQAAHQLELQASQRVYDRVAALSASFAATPKASDADIRTELQKLTQRVDNLEKLVTIHNEAMKAKGWQNPAQSQHGP
jgi:hypothetical protein